MLDKIWASKKISNGTKLCIFNSNIKAVLLYSSETRRKTKVMQKKIGMYINTCLRPIYGIKWQDKISNEELWQRAGQEPSAQHILQTKKG